MFSTNQHDNNDYHESSNTSSLTLNFDDDNLLTPNCCSSPKFNSPPTSPSTTASSSSSSLSDGGYSTSASSNADSSSSLSPLPTTPTLLASPLTTSTTTQQQQSIAALPAIPQQQPLALTRTNSEKLEAENAVLTNACLGLLELLNSQRGGGNSNNNGNTTAAYNALLSRVAAATTNGSNTPNSVSTPSLTPTYPTTTTTNNQPAYTTPTATQQQQYNFTLGHQQPVLQQQAQQQPTLAAPLPSFSFPTAATATTGISRPPQSNTGLNDMSTSGNSSNMGSCYGRRKSYGAPPGVWRNPYGYVSTVYVNKKRVYGPLRKTIEDASRDREAMVQAKEYVTSVEEMRAFVREFLKPNPHGGVAESAVLPNLPTLEDEMLVTL